MSAVDDGTARFEPAGELTLAAVKDWKPSLAAALESGRPAEVDLAGVTDVELPAVQLIISAQRAFAARGLAFSVRDGGDVLNAACRQAGIECWR